MGALAPASLAHAGFFSNLLGSEAQASPGSATGNVQTVGLEPHLALNLASPLGTGGGDITLVSGEALLPDSGPVGTMADVAEWPASGKIASYTVRPGDTLSEIAEMYGVSVNTIAWANNISAKASLQTGQTLIILPVSGVRHTVVKGETLAILARDYHGDAAEIAQYNGLEDGQLAVGDVIIIPNGELAPAPVKPSNKPPKPGANPYRGGSGPILTGYYQAPLANYIKTQGLHGYNGVDLASPQGVGATVRAAASGRVIISKSSGYNGGYGQYVVIEHPNGTQTLYGHLSKNLVSAGEPVEQGEPIGLEGSTGRSTGPHLHFEIRGAANPF